MRLPGTLLLRGHGCSYARHCYGIPPGLKKVARHSCNDDHLCCATPLASLSISVSSPSLFSFISTDLEGCLPPNSVAQEHIAVPCSVPSRRRLEASEEPSTRPFTTHSSRTGHFEQCRPPPTLSMLSLPQARRNLSGYTPSLTQVAQHFPH
jgi:hypothetical protein